MYRMVVRSSTHLRQRPENSRFVVGSENDSLTLRKVGQDMEMAWLGSTWRKEYNNWEYPTLNQIEKGLVAEAMVQIHLAMGDNH